MRGFGTFIIGIILLSTPFSAPSIAAPDINQTEGSLNDTFYDSNINYTIKQSVNLFMRGSTSFTETGGGMVSISYGELNTTKPTNTTDTSVHCPTKGQFPLIVFGDPNMYYIVGGWNAVIPKFSGISMGYKGMSLELWATGKAKDVSFVGYIFGKDLVTETKNVDGPTKFTAALLDFERVQSPEAPGQYDYINLLLYYKASSIQIPITLLADVDVIYDSVQHPSRLTINCNSTFFMFRGTQLENGRAMIDATIFDGLGAYDIADYWINITGPSVAKSISKPVVWKNHSAGTINIRWIWNYKADGAIDGEYRIKVSAIDNNGNVWVSNIDCSNSTVMIKTTDYLGNAILVSAVIMIFIMMVFIVKKKLKKL